MRRGGDNVSSIVLRKDVDWAEGLGAMRVVTIGGIAIAILAAPIAAKAQQASHNWTGFYAGLHAGGGWGDNDVDAGCNDPTGSIDFSPNCSAAIAARAFETDYSTDLSGFIGGGQVGYNFQTGNVVFGLEADISWTSIDGSDSASTNATAVFFAENSRVSQDLEWLGTVRGRIGYATGNWLLFATGGLAYGEVDARYSLSVPASGFSFKDSDSSVETGWTVGGGAEMAFGQWSLKGEYLFYDLGDQDLSKQLVFNGVTLPGKFESDYETQGHIARIGLNYHFDDVRELPLK